MPRGSFSRTVARAAASGGSRSYRSRRPIGWYVLLVAIVISGTFLVGFSRYQHMNPPKTTAEGPTKTSNWNVALAFDVCGAIQPDLPASPNAGTVGIRTFGDGLINIAPAVATKPEDYEGAKATLGNFVSHYPGLTLTQQSLHLPGSKTWTTGDACTGPKKGKGSIVVRVWKSPTSPGIVFVGNPQTIHLDDKMMITVGFVPAGATLAAPASKSKL
jgi:hypothetical protein